MRNPRVPDRITSPVRRLCNRIAPGTLPLFVKVCPEADANSQDCFINVENKVKKSGGKIQYGWAIWYVPGLLMEAEFHSVWLSPEGNYIDVSPNEFSFSEIMFLPDPHRVYAGRQIDNIRIPLNKNPQVKEFIRLHEAKFKVLNEGELATRHGAVSVPSEKIRPIIERLAQLSIDLDKE